MSGTGKKRVRKEDVTTFDECDAGSWECTVCTYRNRFEAFKCEMCDTRKGTSTRKPRLNENVVQMQKVVQNFVVQQQEKAASRFFLADNIGRLEEIFGSITSVEGPNLT
ncbi:Zn-finger in Ran binding protein [Ancylostoma ceylanicum]|uniref:Zn-finger in Ran binding protein n=1 Tax=Ancylostoma ceylanicum TaxID=53326 RepID=A0A0D6M321_9BILA|nr:Zn-finger in Ran binding protein [Ancylostoma ceylanicum]